MQNKLQLWCHHFNNFNNFKLVLVDDDEVAKVKDDVAPETRALTIRTPWTKRTCYAPSCTSRYKMEETRKRENGPLVFNIKRKEKICE